MGTQEREELGGGKFNKNGGDRKNKGYKKIINWRKKRRRKGLKEEG